jgi:site-specific recombinase XerD
MLYVKLPDNILFKHIHDFLKVYLPKRKNYSEHTVKAYSSALSQLINFVKTERNVLYENVTCEMLTADMLNAWLDSLESVHGCGIKTRNQRRASIGAFLKYAAKVDVSVVMFRNELKKVPAKKTGQLELVEHMSEKAITVLLDTPNPATNKGLRDRFFMLLMYDTGARCQEILDLRIKDVRLGETPTATLMGKGSKVRVTPIRPTTAEYLHEYLVAFHPQESAYSEQPLFYSTLHGMKRKLSSPWARRMVSAYGVLARAKCLEVPEQVHCHLLRHSRAMHLYQHGMDLTLVSQWLGHANMETTLVYAHADTEHKRQAIAAASQQGDPLSAKLNSERYTLSDEDALKKLCGLR